MTISFEYSSKPSLLPFPPRSSIGYGQLGQSMPPPIVLQPSPHALRQKQFETFVLSLAPTRCSVALSKVLLPSLTHWPWNASLPGINRTASLCGQKPLTSLKTAQKAFSSNKTIFIPKPDDQLWIVTDGSVKMHGLGLVLPYMPFVTTSCCLPISSVLRPESIRSLGFFAKSKPYLLLQPLNTSLPTNFRQIQSNFLNVASISRDGLVS